MSTISLFLFIKFNCGFLTGQSLKFYFGPLLQMLNLKIQEYGGKINIL